MPATNGVSERSSSAWKPLKTYDQQAEMPRLDQQCSRSRNLLLFSLLFLAWVASVIITRAATSPLIITWYTQAQIFRDS